MNTFNIFNVINHLNQSLKNKYIIEKSEINSDEINFSNDLLEIIENYIYSINEDFEEGQIDIYEEGFFHEDKEKKENESFDPDYEIEKYG